MSAEIIDFSKRARVDTGPAKISSTTVMEDDEIEQDKSDSRFTERKSSGPNMHTFVFRSYDLIVKSDDATLLRDVRCDVHKAEVKLNRIRRALHSHREQAAARDELMTKAEAKLAAAIDEAQKAAGVSRNAAARHSKDDFNANMRRRIREVAALRELSADQIKPALTLGHQKVATFCMRHGVRFEWLLEGIGRVFKDDDK